MLIVKDWSKVDMENPVDRANVLDCLKRFLNIGRENPVIRDAIQHFGQSGDFPASALEIMKKYLLTPEFDTVYTEIFNILDMTGSNRSGFKILDVESGIAFNEVPVGQKAKLYNMWGSEVTVDFVLYAAGLHWHKTLFDDKEYWTLEDNAAVFRNRADYDRAYAYYSLIEAIPPTYDLAWQAATPAAMLTSDANYQAVRDFNTINLACSNIITRLRGKGMGVGMKSEFLVLVPHIHLARYNRAMGLYNAGLAGGAFAGVQYKTSLRYTICLDTTNVIYVILPKQKMMGGNRMNLTPYYKTDITTYSEMVVGWQRFGGAIGDITQLVRCAMA